MEPSYEIFDHTADAGIRVRAASLAELVAPAGEALYVIIGDLEATRETAGVAFDLAGSDAATLLRDYLHELLILFDRDSRMVTAADVETFTDQRLAVAVQAAAVDRDRSEYLREVKAITYHELGIRTIPGGYEATVIVDI